MITMHIETIGFTGFKKQAMSLKKKGVNVGVSLNPATPLVKIKKVLPFVDFVLVMSVNPGFSGQAFIPAALGKIKKLRKIFKGDIAVDGGINEDTALKAVRAGANVLAAGSYIFGSQNYKTSIERIRNVR